MNRSYTQLTEIERYQIWLGLSLGNTQTKIADCLNVHKSTISREIRRNSGQRGYQPRQAHQLSLARRKTDNAAKLSQDIWDAVDTLIRKDWSPQQASEWLKRNTLYSVSHESIYLHVYEDQRTGGDLIKHLRCQKQRKKRYGKADRRGQLKDRRSIEERPLIVDERVRIGDWEADTVAGRQTGARLVTLTERKSRYTLIGLAKDKSSESVTKTILRLLKNHPGKIKTITYDNGKEFAGHKEIEKQTGSKAYFAHPYHSWERGLNENTNGLIRQYFPKGSDFNKLHHAQVKAVQNKLNQRPRRCLDYETPQSVYIGL
jgi:IS30 family transposase